MRGSWKHPAVVLLVVFGLVFAACGDDDTATTTAPDTTTTAAPTTSGPPETTTTAPAEPTELVVGKPAEALSLDPAYDNGGLTQNMLDNVFGALITADNDLNQVGLLAESWEFIEPDTWRFHLRQGVRAHNGDEMTAEDVKFSYDRISDPAAESPMATYISNLRGVAVVDDYTVDFFFDGFDALWPERTKVIHIVPKRAVEEMGLEEFGKLPVGWGPYEVVEWVKDDRLVLEAFDDYFLGRAAIDTVIMKPIPEPSTRVAALQTGEVDIISAIGPQFVPELEANEGIDVVIIEGGRTHQMIMDTNVPPLDNVNVRRAIAQAIDYDSLIEFVAGGFVTRNCQPVAPIMFGYDPELVGDRCWQYNPDEARRLLQEAGLAEGFTLEFRGPTGSTPNDKEIQEAIIGMMAEVNITLNYEILEFGRWLEGYRVREWPITYHTNGSRLLDADQVFGIFYKSTGRGYYTSPEMDVLIAAELAERDRETRRQLMQDIIAQAVDQVYWVSLFTQSDIWAMKDTVSFQPRADENYNFYRASLSS